MSDSTPEPTLITHPTGGIPPVVDTHNSLTDAIEALAGGSGPIAVDTERAHGFRYTTKAYLVQLHREGSGTFLIDPIAFEVARTPADLSELGSAISDAEWILHAASQDLNCLSEVNLVPQALFDTELAGRLLGLPKVSLGILVEELLGVYLLKAHSASDWSKRPLPDDWLAYAALDVELLGELRDVIAAELETAGKTEWASQEFAYLVEHASDVPARRDDPWRRTSGLHAVRTPLGLAYVRELWAARDELARHLDIAPGRLLGDKAITELASRIQPRRERTRLGKVELRSVGGFRWRNARKYEDVWLAALDRVADLPESERPPTAVRANGPGVPRTWASKHPASFARWQRIRPAIVELAEKLSVPPENLIPPDALRLLCFAPPQGGDIDAFLADLGVRLWQRQLVVPVVAPLV